MNTVKNMFEEFLNLLGYVPKRQVAKERTALREAYNLAFKEGYNKGYDDGVNCSPHRYNRKRVTVPETIVLFVKADRAATIIDCIKNTGNLIGVNGNLLVSDTLRIWVGTSKQFDSSGIPALFTIDGEISDIGREYDSVAIKIPYPSGNVVIDSSSDSFAIGQIIRKTCEQGLSCEAISNRLPFSKIEPLALIEV